MSLSSPTVAALLAAPVNFSDEESRAGIHLPGGLEYTHAEMGVGNTSSKGEIDFELNDGYGQLAHLHRNQDGVIHQDIRIT